MILSQITRSDVRFELLLCTSEAENLSPVVSSVAQSVSSVSQSVPVVGPGTITVVAVVGISIGSRLGSSGGLGISGPLAIVGIRVSSITISAVEEGRISLSLWLSLSGPLAVVQAMMGIGVTVSIGSVASVGVRMAVVPVVGVSLSLRLGLWLTGDEGGKANHKSELHCCLSVESRMILSSRRAQFIPPESPPVRATSRLL